MPRPLPTATATADNTHSPLSGSSTGRAGANRSRRALRQPAVHHDATRPHNTPASLDPRLGTQRQRLPVPRLAGHLPRPRDQPQEDRPYRPQTNGKTERFHRTLAARWAFRRRYFSESARRGALPAWLHEYNHHRPHTAIRKQAPITRCTNVSGQYS